VGGPDQEEERTRARDHPAENVGEQQQRGGTREERENAPPEPRRWRTTSVSSIGNLIAGVSLQAKGSQ
jgi:hypothetical protein